MAYHNQPFLINRANINLSGSIPQTTDWLNDTVGIFIDDQKHKIVVVVVVVVVVVRLRHGIKKSATVVVAAVVVADVIVVSAAIAVASFRLWCCWHFSSSSGFRSYSCCHSYCCSKCYDCRSCLSYRPASCNKSRWEPFWRRDTAERVKEEEAGNIEIQKTTLIKITLTTDNNNNKNNNNVETLS